MNGVFSMGYVIIMKIFFYEKKSYKRVCERRKKYVWWSERAFNITTLSNDPLSKTFLEKKSHSCWLMGRGTVMFKPHFLTCQGECLLKILATYPVIVQEIFQLLMNRGTLFTVEFHMSSLDWIVINTESVFSNVCFSGCSHPYTDVDFQPH